MTPPRVPCRAVRPLPLLLAVLLLVGCSASPRPVATSSEADERDAVLVDLRAEVAAVAEQQATADEATNDVLAAVRRVDEAVAALGDVTEFDATLSGYVDGVHVVVAEVDATGLRDGYLAAAEEVDVARQTLADARARLDDPWEVTYLDAQDEVLLAVRDYARTADRLAQLLEQHWPTYEEVDTRVTDFAGRRGNYRDTPEAAAALAVELDTVIDDLAVAEAQIADYRRRRADAGEVVNEASSAAVEVYEQRPSASLDG